MMTSIARVLAPLMLLASVIVLSSGTAVAGCASFDWVNPWPQGNHLRAVADNGDVFVAVGDHGTILVSFGATSWTRAPLVTYHDLHDVRWTPFGFVAVGDRGAAVRSADGVHWEAFFAGTLQNLRTVVWTGSELVISSDAYPLLRTTDLVEWVVDEIEPMEAVDMEWGKGVFVAITATEVLVSPTALSWTAVAAGAGNSLFDLAFSGSEFVVVGGGGLFWRSLDGSAWEALDTGVNSELFAVSLVDGYLAVGVSGLVLTSPDGSAWWAWDSGSELDLLALAANDALDYVAVGTSGTMAWSHGGRDWTVLSEIATADDLVAVAPFGSRFVAVSGRLPAKAPSRLYWSDDGADWARGTLAGSIYLADVACGPTVCVAVGEGQVATSADGVAWQARAATGVKLRGVAWEGGRWVAVGARGSAGAILTSFDGVAWDDVTPPGGPVLNGVAASPTTWVAVGPSGAVVSSASGSNWTAHALDTTKDLRAVAWTGDRFVAVGDRSLIAVSDDGEEWTMLPAPTAAEPVKAGVTTFRDVARVGDGVGIVGDDGAMLLSVDGLSWGWKEFPTDAALTAVAWNGQQEVVVGAGGTILRRFCPPRVRRPGDRVEAN